MHMEPLTTTEDESQLLTSWQAAQRLGISENRLRQLRSQGRGPTYLKRPGPPQSDVRYRPQDVDKWIEEQNRYVVVETTP